MDGRLKIDRLVSINDTPLELISDGAGGMDHVKIIVAIAVCLLNITFQSIVVHLLRTLAKNRGKTIGGVLSLHLCVIEICIPVFILVAILLSIINVSDGSAVRFIAVTVAILLTSSLFLFKLSLMFTEVLKIKISTFLVRRKSDVLGRNYLDFWCSALDRRIGCLETLFGRYNV